MTSKSCIILIILLMFMQQQIVAEDICQQDSDCQNGGSCESDLAFTDHGEITSRCICTAGFWGDHCEKPCQILCENGGQCRLESDEHGGLDVATDFVCDCPKGFGGPLCSQQEQAVLGQEPSSSLSAGAKLGISLGAIVGVSVPMLLVVWARRKNNRREIELTDLETTNDVDVDASIT